MADVYTHVSHNSLGDNLFRSLKMFLSGIVLFLVSFPILWINEGLTDMSSVAKQATVVPSNQPGSAGEGRLISTTGPLGVAGKVGDPDMVAEGDYVMLHRKVEAYVWKEKEEKRTEKQLGGGSRTITTYTYDRVWTDAPQDSSNFTHPEDHQNPPITARSEKRFAEQATVGSFTFDPAEAELPAATELTLGKEMLAIPLPEPVKPKAKAPAKSKAAAKNKAAKQEDDDEEPAARDTADDYRFASGFLYRGTGSPVAPVIGDVRVSYEAVLPGAQVTLYGQRQGTTVVAYVHEGSDRLFRAVAGTHEQALGTLHGEHVARTWMLRFVGFFCMWIGLALLLAPFNAVLDILPFLGSAGRFVTGLLMAPVALVISSIVIVIAIVAHSPILLVLTLLSVIGGGIAWIVMRKKAKQRSLAQAPAPSTGFAPAPGFGQGGFTQPAPSYPTSAAPVPQGSGFGQGGFGGGGQGGFGQGR